MTEANNHAGGGARGVGPAEGVDGGPQSGLTAGPTMLLDALVVTALLLWALVRGVWPANRRPAGHHRRGQQIEFAPREA